MSTSSNNSSNSTISISEALAKWTGTWKRTTTNFVFGGTFSRGKDSTSYVMIEPTGNTNTNDISMIQWSFGSSTEAIRYGFTLGLSTNPSSSSLSSPLASPISPVITTTTNDISRNWIKLQLLFSSSSTSSMNTITNNTSTTGSTNNTLLNTLQTQTLSTATMREDGMILSIQLIQNALATIVYRMLDDDSKYGIGNVNSIGRIISE